MKRKAKSQPKKTNTGFKPTPCLNMSKAVKEALSLHKLPIEKDPHGADQHAPGAKLDDGKTPVMKGAIRQFPYALEYVARVSAKGAAKYTWGGWRTVPNGEERYADARARHELALAKGEKFSDIGELHLAQIAWNALAELDLYLRAGSST